MVERFVADDLVEEWWLRMSVVTCSLGGRAEADGGK